MMTRLLTWATFVNCVVVVACPVGAANPSQLEQQDRQQVIQKAAARLIALQAADGAWAYEGVYRVRGKIPLGYRVGGTAIACSALLASEPSDPLPAQQAIAKGVAIILAELDHPRMQPSDEDRYDVRVWGHIYALELFCRLKLSGDHEDLVQQVEPWIPKLIAALEFQEISGGGWNYAGQTKHASFVTAPALQALLGAKELGYQVPNALFERGAQVLIDSRNRRGAFRYSGSGANDALPLPGSIARSAICETTLSLLGHGNDEHLRHAIDAFHEHWDELEKRRKKTGTHRPPYGIAPYYFYYGHRYVAQAIRMLPASARTEQFDKFEEVLMRTMDEDHTWNDRVFPQSKAYGTAMAVLALTERTESTTLPGLRSRPNIVVIMADDMGFSDIGCYGGEIETPNLDRLAAGGLRFTQFYNTGRCCPTRASLLTGLYPHQTGIGWMMRDQGLAGYRGDLNQRCLTIAEVLRAGGYATYMSGKWHVTKHNQPRRETDKFNWPLQRGFERFYGIINGASSFWDPNSLVRDNQLITCVNDSEYQPAEPYHFTDAVSDQAVRFIREHPSDRPMMMYVAYTAAHWPLHARTRDIKKYSGRYDDGYAAVRAARLEKMKRLGLVPPQTQLPPTVGDWDQVRDPEWEADCMEVYAAMIDQMDQGIGRILSALEAKGELDNTLIMFLQDNGGCAEACGRNADPQQRQLREAAPSLPPIAIDHIHYFSSIPKQTRDGWPVRQGHVQPGPPDTYIGYGRNWANVSNTPLREYKHWVHEGGIATPLIVHWPNGFQHRGELRRQPAHLIDIMATCVDVAGTTYPRTYRGHTIQPLEGVSLVPAFHDQRLSREALFWEHEGHRAIRQGAWKLVAKGNLRDREKPVRWELYDLDSDRLEQVDLASQYPERVKSLATRWQQYAERTGVFPCPKPQPQSQ